MRNSALKYLFNRIYNNGKLTNLIVTRSTVNKLNNFYKMNFEDSANYESFLVDLGSLKDQLLKSKSAAAEYEKQYTRSMALQPAILSECFVAQTLADMFELDEFLDADEKEENIPSQLLLALIRARGGELEAAIPRYIYYSNTKNIVLLQYGDSSSIDAVFVKDGYRVRLELKEEKAKLGEYDLNYNEEGTLIPTQNIIENHKEYISFIDRFNEVTNVFSHMGSNFKIGSYLTDELLESIVAAVFDLKKIDLYILQKGRKIFCVPSRDLISSVDVSGSEIRMTGKNKYKVFTPNKLNELLNNLGATISDGIVSVPYDQNNNTIGRGRSVITRYKLNSLFLVEYKNIIINDGIVSFRYNDIRQIKCTISVHLYSTINHDSLQVSNLTINENN